MDLDPRRLLILRAVALRGGVSDAAVMLHLTASAVSQQIALLEREVGVSLLDRSQRPAGLTAAGQLLAARAERINNELAGAKRELTALSGRLSGPAVIASFSSVIRNLFLPAISVLADTHPDLRPCVVELEGSPALKELRSGGVDLVVTEQEGGVEQPRYPGLAVKPLGDDAYRIVVPSAWEQDIRSWKNLVPRPWIAGRAGTPSAQVLDRLAAKHGFIPSFVHHCVEYPTVLSMVAAGMGAAIIPVLALASEPTEQIFVTRIPTGGFRRLCAVYRATDQGPEPMVLVLLSALEEAAREKGLDPVSEKSRI